MANSAVPFGTGQTVGTRVVHCARGIAVIASINPNQHKQAQTQSPHVTPDPQIFLYLSTGLLYCEYMTLYRTLNYNVHGRQQLGE